MKRKTKILTAMMLSSLVSASSVCAEVTKTAVNASQSDGAWWRDSAKWNPQGVPGATDSCLVPSARSAVVNRFGTDAAETVAFTGDSLQIGTVGGALVVMVDQSTPNRNLTFPGSGLVFGSASFRAWDNVPNAKIDGNLTVLSPVSAPSDFTASKANTTYQLLGRLIGEADSCLDLNAENDTSVLTFPLTFDATDFYGHLRYRPRTMTMQSTFGNVTFNGTIEAERTQFTIPIDVRPTVSKLKVSAAGVDLMVGVENAIGGDRRSGLLTIRDGIELAEGAKIRYRQTAYPNGWKQNDDGRTLWPFLTVPLDAALDVDDIVPMTTHAMTSGWFYPDFDIIVTTNLADRTKTFVSRRRAYVQVETDTHAYNSDASKFAWNSYDEDQDYFVKGSATGRKLNTPPQRDSVFGGKSLCIWSDASDVSQCWGLNVRSQKLTIDDLRYQSGCWLKASEVFEGADSVEIDGSLTLFKGRASDDFRTRILLGGANKSIVLSAAISGEGDLIAEGVAGDARSLTLAGDNSSWTGQLLLTNADGGSNRLLVSHRNALGGSLPEFRHDALTLGDKAIFGADVDVELTEATRGICVRDTQTAKFSVDGSATLTLGQTLSFEGTGSVVTKVGTGTLVLSGDPSRRQGAAGTLVVAEGSVGVKTGTELTGVTVSCSGNGAFALALPGDAPSGVGVTGIVDPDLANGSPFNVTIAAETCPDHVVRVPVCTVAVEKLPAVRSALRYVKSVPGMGCRLTEEPVGDGRIRIVANVGKMGLILVFR